VKVLILPSDAGFGVFHVLAARVRSGVDFGLPAEGVEVYSVDQRGTVCGLGASEVCFGPDRRTTPVPAVNSLASTAHVYGPGSSLTIGGVTVEVLARNGDQFTLRVSGSAVSERFVDDNGNLHEANITAIALQGITVGCNPPLNSFYCPGNRVTRAEMAALLLRAIGQPPDPSVPYRAYFSDVPSGQWYTPFVERLFELGITSGIGEGRYGPDLPVTRAEMSAFLVRAFALASEPATGAFSDVAITEWYAGFTESLLRAGITAGCSADPLMFCPSDPVLRDQMASFLARALAAG
jgi:hypothetical protein